MEFWESEEGPFWGENTPLPPENAEFGGHYITTASITSTNCSFIYIGRDIQDNSKKAIKFIKRIARSIHRVKNEIYTMKLANHPYILKVDDLFPYREYIGLVTPYATSGSLHRLVQTGYPNGLPETMAKLMMCQMLEAVNYLHGISIWHRDIKLDNFLVFDPNPERPKIVLADFGFAKLFSEGESGTEYIGTPEFAAPEMYKNIPYDKSVDIWSLGIVLYVMLTCKYPFPSFRTCPRQCRRLILNGALNYPLLERKRDVSNDAIDLIQKMCQVNPSDRITAEEALLHPWIASSKKLDYEGEIANALYVGENENEFNDQNMV